MNALIQVDLSRTAIRRNAEFFRRIAPGGHFMAVVKSNAYGHGLPFAVRALQGLADWFGVNSLEEAAEIRKIDVTTPILVMGAVDLHPDLSELLAALNGVTLVVSGIEGVERIQKAAPGIPFHIKVDTGMSRLGTRTGELEAVFEYLKANSDLHWTGLMTHFADVEDVTEQQFAKKQLAEFLNAKEMALRCAGGKPLLFHAAASAAAMVLPESRLDMIRVGISLYGLWPSRSTRISLLHLTGELIELNPVLTWRAQIVHTNLVPPGTTIGYGRTFKTQVETRVAVIPVGYNEGYARVLSNNAFVIVRGKRARLLGRVCMNMIMVDVTDIPGIEAGDTAILIGAEGEERITAEEIGDLSSTINYEVVSRIHPDLPRCEIE